MAAPAPLVLLAEDDRNIRETTTDLLMLAGFRVRAEPTGRAAAAALREEAADVVVTDLRMPDGDGPWLMERVRELEPERRPALLLLTAYVDISAVDRDAKSRADACLAKPFEPEELIETLRRLLSARTGAGRPPVP